MKFIKPPPIFLYNQHNKLQAVLPRIFSVLIRARINSTIKKWYMYGMVQPRGESSYHVSNKQIALDL